MAVQWLIASVLLTSGLSALAAYVGHRRLLNQWNQRLQQIQQRAQHEQAVALAAAQRQHADQIQKERESAEGRVAEVQVAQTQLQARLNSRIADYHRVNQELIEQNSSLRSSVDSISQQITVVQSAMEHLRRETMVVVRHTVFLDGMPRSGKTTFLERLVNPTATPEQLLAQESTPNPYLTQPVPLAWEEVEGNRVLHAVDFVDIAGERGAGISDMLDTHEDRVGHLRVVGLPAPRAVALVLWDASISGSENLSFLSPARIEAIYGARKARTTFKAILVFLNKFDALPQLGGPVSGDVEERVRQHRRAIEGEAFERIAGMYPPLSITFGSALTGAGVHQCLGEVVKALDLAHLFARPGASGAGGPTSSPPIGSLEEARHRSRTIRFGPRS